MGRHLSGWGSILARTLHRRSVPSRLQRPQPALQIVDPDISSTMQSLYLVHTIQSSLSYHPVLPIKLLRIIWSLQSSTKSQSRGLRTPSPIHRVSNCILFIPNQIKSTIISSRILSEVDTPESITTTLLCNMIGPVLTVVQIVARIRCESYYCTSAG